MKSWSTLVAIGTGLLVSICLSTEANQSLELTLEGSRWTLVNIDPEYGDTTKDLIFREGGKLEIVGPSPHVVVTPGNDFWDLDRTKIVLRVNDRYAVYEGEILDDRTMAGAATNTAGLTWEWKAHRDLGASPTDVPPKQKTAVHVQTVAPAHTKTAVSASEAPPDQKTGSKEAVGVPPQPQTAAPARKSRKKRETGIEIVFVPAPEQQTAAPENEAPPEEKDPPQEQSVVTAEPETAAEVPGVPPPEKTGARDRVLTPPEPKTAAPQSEVPPAEKASTQKHPVTLIEPTAPAGEIPRAGKMVKVSFRSDRSLQGERLVLVVGCSVYEYGVSYTERYLYDGHGFSITAGTEGEIEFLLSPPQVSTPTRNQYGAPGAQSSVVVQGTKEISVGLAKCVSDSCDRRITLSNQVTISAEFVK